MGVENSSSCTCETYGDLTADRKSINLRIKESKQLKKLLSLITDKADRSNKLYRCNSCGQLWQGSYAWNWGGYEYLFKVPAINLDQWRIEPYVQPDELILYIALMQQYHERIDPTETTSICTVAGCGKHAVKLSMCCLQHQIEQLQAIGILPKKPPGIYFPPYDGN
jgi:hypothetical protein